MRRITKIPLPALVGAEPYGTLCTPLLDRDAAEDAAARMLQQARDAGAHALILRTMSLEGAAMNAIRTVLARDGLRLRVLSAYQRAQLDATRDADELLRDALGPKKLKELRRQRQRLAEHGALRFDVARTPHEVASALEIFLALESGGWKGKRGTALSQHAGDAAFHPPRDISDGRDWPLRDQSRCMPVTRRWRAASWCVIRTAPSSSRSASTSSSRNILPARS